MPERIAKYLARAGIASRREAEELVKQGRITVNGETVETPAFLVNGDENILFDGERIKPKDKPRLWLYHKPAGFVTTHKDEKGRDTVFDHLPAGLPRVISVGRLDLNSEGLLLLTNDGGLSRALELPENGWSRRYKVRVRGRLDERRLKQLEKGAVIDGIAYGACKITLEKRPGAAEKSLKTTKNRHGKTAEETETAAKPSANAWLTISLNEGKNREVRRLMASVGLEVSRLIRLSYGPFQLGSLKRGEVREVPQKTLKEQLGSLFALPEEEKRRAPAQDKKQKEKSEKK